MSLSSTLSLLSDQYEPISAFYMLTTNFIKQVKPRFTTNNRAKTLKQPLFPKISKFFENKLKAITGFFR